MTDADDDAVKPKAEEEPDEWTALADTYASALVPSFAPIYRAVADLVGDGGPAPEAILDFGCGPGEPALTIAERFPSTRVTAADSSRAMLDIASRRSEERGAGDRIEFRHVRRDATMEELAESTGGAFDAVVSAFTLHYVAFPRRVELVSRFLKMAPDVWIVAWGGQSRVGFLHAIKIFGAWKGGAGGDICEVRVDPEDDGEVESPGGSFTLCREECFQGIVDRVDGGRLTSFETRSIPLRFPSVMALLGFLPFPTNEHDVESAWKLLKSWGTDRVRLGDGPDAALSFPTDVVFCHIARSTKHCSGEGETSARKRPKGDEN